MAKVARKLVYGVGINDAGYAVTRNHTDPMTKKSRQTWICPFYLKWRGILARCYSESQVKENPSYKDCSICQEWLIFSNFKAWMEKQDWQNKQLDKDLLFPGNKVYSPETCVFVDQRVNNFLIETGAARGEYMIGVCWHKQKNRFIAQCNDYKGKKIYLGCFDSELEAHQTWLAFKLKIAYELASEQTNQRIAKALVKRYENYEVVVDTK